MLIQIKSYKCLILVSLAIFLLSSCTNREYQFYSGTENDKKLIQLFKLLDRADEDHESKMEVYYTIINRIISEYRSMGEMDRMNLFLSDYINTHEGDPYTAYYLLKIAENYKNDHAQNVAEIYYRRILYNYPDLTINGQSIHKVILDELAFNSDNDEERIQGFKGLLTRFPKQIDQGQIYYFMGKSYEKLGLWNEAMASYENFLNSPETEIAGDPKARITLTNLLRFHHSDKSWTRENLNQLVTDITTSIRRRTGSRLNRYKADPFFTMGWSQEETDLFTHTNIDIPSFLNSRIYIARDLDPMSNDKEAYLWTSGWSYRINTWYLYFKRIDYPADPEINGRWEWAGILFGENF